MVGECERTQGNDYKQKENLSINISRRLLREYCLRLFIILYLEESV